AGGSLFNPTPIDRTVATVLSNVTSFLYTGANPTQTGVLAGTIVPTTAAVVRGHVRDRSGSPLAGVTVTIVGHPEFGTTHTRSDGAFDMAVNGGQQLRIRYALEGYFT